MAGGGEEKEEAEEEEQAELKAEEEASLRAEEEAGLRAEPPIPDLVRPTNLESQSESSQLPGFSPACTPASAQTSEPVTVYPTPPLPAGFEMAPPPPGFGEVALSEFEPAPIPLTLFQQARLRRDEELRLKAEANARLKAER